MHFVELSKVGEIIFPKFMNYLAIAIMEKVKLAKDIDLIRIKGRRKKS